MSTRHADWCGINRIVFPYLRTGQQAVTHIGRTGMASGRTRCTCALNPVATRLRKLRKMQEV